MMNFDEKQVVSAIQDAEKATSGEVRVHITSKSEGEIYAQAKDTFEKLGMTATEARNGILFFIAEESKQFTILGDKGIHDHVHQEFWDHLRDIMVSDFRNGDFTQGLCKAIRECGERLKEFFPYQKDDVNELDDSISRD